MASYTLLMWITLLASLVAAQIFCDTYTTTVTAFVPIVVTLTPPTLPTSSIATLPTDWSGITHFTPTFSTYVTKTSHHVFTTRRSTILTPPFSASYPTILPHPVPSCTLDWPGTIGSDTISLATPSTTDGETWPSTTSPPWWATITDSESSVISVSATFQPGGPLLSDTSTSICLPTDSSTSGFSVSVRSTKSNSPHSLSGTATTSSHSHTMVPSSFTSTFRPTPTPLPITAGTAGVRDQSWAHIFFGALAVVFTMTVALG